MKKITPSTLTDLFKKQKAIPYHQIKLNAELLQIIGVGKKDDIEKYDSLLTFFDENLSDEEILKINNEKGHLILENWLKHQFVLVQMQEIHYDDVDVTKYTTYSECFVLGPKNRINEIIDKGGEYMDDVDKVIFYNGKMDAFNPMKVLLSESYSMDKPLYLLDASDSRGLLKYYITDDIQHFYNKYPDTQILIEETKLPTIWL